MTEVSIRPPLAALSDDDLLAAWHAADLDDPETFGELMAEMTRRDRLERTAKARAGMSAVLAEGYDAAYAQYLAASEYCRGRLLSELGRKRVTDEISLWTGSEETALRYASEELRDFWLYVQPRISPGSYARQRGAQLRAERERYEYERETSEGSTQDDHDHDRAGERAVIAGPAAGTLRPEPAAAQAQERAGGAVLRGGRPAAAVPGSGCDAGAGRPGGPVRGDAVTVTAEAPAPFAYEPDAGRPADAAGYMAKAAGCKHYRTKYGTPAQCGDCPAARLGPVRAPSEVAVRQDVIDVRPSQMVTAARYAPNGAELLANSYNGFRHFAVWPSEAALVTATLWTAQRHAVDKDWMPVWQYSPHMFFTGKEGGCGKSAMTKLVLRLAPNPKLLLEPTKAALVAFIAKRATVGITEMDVLVGTGTRNRWLVAIANGAFDPEPTTSKMSGGKELEIPLFGGMVLDGLDSVIHSTGVELKTLMSRCIIQRVRKAPDGYRAPRMDGRARDAFAWQRDQLAQWMAYEVAAGIGEDVPEVPEGLGNRPASLWEPLFAVADRAGGDWPERAREACETLEAAAGLPQDEEEDTRQRSVFDAWAAKAAAQADDDSDLL